MDEHDGRTWTNIKVQLTSSLVTCSFLWQTLAGEQNPSCRCTGGFIEFLHSPNSGVRIEEHCSYSPPWSADDDDAGRTVRVTDSSTQRNTLEKGFRVITSYLIRRFWSINPPGENLPYPSEILTLGPFKKPHISIRTKIISRKNRKKILRIFSSLWSSWHLLSNDIKTPYLVSIACCLLDGKFVFHLLHIEDLPPGIMSTLNPLPLTIWMPKGIQLEYIQVSNLQVGYENCSKVESP